MSRNNTAHTFSSETALPTHLWEGRFFAMTVRQMALLAVGLAMLSACGTDSSHFRIEGRFRNFNRGEFYVYSPDGGISSLDTIAVQDGRFAYERPLTREATFVLVFPNFSEHPVFASPGRTADIKADASHLKEMSVSGSEDNELMTDFRKYTSHMSPPETERAAQELIQSHPESAVGKWLIVKYFLKKETPDYKKALKLTQLMLKHRPNDGRLVQQERLLKTLSGAQRGTTLTPFETTDIDGKKYNTRSLRGKVAVVNVCAAWSAESMNIQRKLRQLKKTYGDKLELLTVSMDASKKICAEHRDRDSTLWTTICDELVWDSPVMQKLSLSSVPDNIILNRAGRVVARNVSAENMEKEIIAAGGKP